MSRRSALTLIEMMVVIAIALITMAIAVPIARKAIHASKVRQSCAQLKQIHMAMTLYRTDHGGEGKYGVPYWQMGLPPGYKPLVANYGLTMRVLIPPGIGTLPHGPRYYIAYPYSLPHPGRQQEWERYTERAQDRSVLSYDISLDDTGNPHGAERCMHNFIGMYADGYVKPIRQIGFHGEYNFWLKARNLAPLED